MGSLYYMNGPIDPPVKTSFVVIVSNAAACGETFSADGLPEGYNLLDTYLASDLGTFGCSGQVVMI